MASLRSRPRPCGYSAPTLLAAVVLLIGSIGVVPAQGQNVNWVTSQTPATGSMPQSIAVGDFNGDGIPDIAVGEAGKVGIFLGNGDGTFKAATTVSAPSGTLAIAAGAFVTGKPEGLIVVTNASSATNNAFLILSDGAGGETATAPFSLPFGSASSVVTGDFNGDGKQDFAVTAKSDNKVVVFLGNGNGTFGAPKTISTGSGPIEVAVGNFHGAGKLDLAVLNGDNTITPLLNDGTGTFTAGSSLSLSTAETGSQAVGLAIGDLNGDGTSDLAVLKSGIDTFLIFLGKGDGTFGTPTIFPGLQGSSAIAVGDFNGDGRLDVAAASPQGQDLIVFVGDGAGDFTPASTSPMVGNTPVAMVTGNFNGPGGADVAVVNNPDDTLTILLSHAGSLSPTPTPTPTPSPTPTPTPTPPGGGSGGSSARLINISTRAQVGTGGNILIPGLVVGGSGTETLLVRADGPSLTQFSVPGVLAQPTLSVYSGSTLIASNTGWSTNSNPTQIASVAAQVGAFAFQAGSADCALIVNLSAGSYTVQISGANNTTGVALAEVYEVASAGTRLVNISTRAEVGTGGNILIPGFVISGTGTEELLVRADGPGLTPFGVSGVLAQPSLSVYSAALAIASNTGWTTGTNAAQIMSVAASVGAFAFAPGSADSAQIVNLSAGAYTIQVSGVDGTTGVALAEVYEVPQD